MLKRLFNNRKGTAEVIGSVMFIVILLFFFTNVYLWHDAATKEMNDMYVEKINTPITLSVVNGGSNLAVTNNGGSDTVLSTLWVAVKSSNANSPDTFHYNFTLNVKVAAGETVTVSSHYVPSGSYDKTVQFKVITSTGNMATRNFIYS